MLNDDKVERETCILKGAKSQAEPQSDVEPNWEREI